MNGASQSFHDGKGQPSVKMPKSRKSFLKISALLTKFQFSVDILFFCPYNELHKRSAGA